MARTGREKSSYVIHSVLNALNLLEQFIHSKGELGVTELSKRLGLHKNNVFRLLATLESKGYIEQNKTTDNYRLGIKSLELGQTYIHQMGLVHHAHPIMEELAKTCKENVYLGIVQANVVVYLDLVEAVQVVRVASRIGQQLPIHCSSIGKVQVAFMSESEFEKLNFRTKEVVVCVLGDPIKTSSVLANGEQRYRIRESGHACLRDCENGLDLASFISSSWVFARDAGLATDRMKKAIDEIGGIGQGSMVMLGNSIFAFGDVEALERALEPHGQVFRTGICQNGAMIL